MLDGIRNKKKLCCGIIILEFIIVGMLFGTGFYVDRSFSGLSFTQDDLVYETGEAGFYLDHSYDYNYILTPGFVLPKGFYTLYAECEYSGWIRLEVVNSDTRLNSTLSNPILLDGPKEVSGDFEVRYDDSMVLVQARLALEPTDGNYILIRNLRIVPNYSLTMRNRFFDLIVFVLLIDIILVLILFHDRIVISDEQKVYLKALVILTIVISVPLMVNYLFTQQHDLRFHLNRIEGLKEGLLEGDFPVRMQSYWLHGHGYPVSIFYGDLLLYIPAILRIFGVPIQTAYNIYILMINAGTVVISFYCFSRMSNNRTGLICTTIYSLNIYRLFDIYTRAAVGEYTVMMFMPLVLYGMWSIYMRSEGSEEHRKSWIPLTIGCTGIFLSHMVSTEMTAFFMILTAVILWRRTLCKKTLFVLLKAAVATTLLSVWFLIPFYDYMKSGTYVVTTSLFKQYRLEKMGTFPAQLFMNRHSVLASTTDLVSGTVSDMPLTLGLASLGILAGWFVFCMGKRRAGVEKKEEYLAVFLCILSLLMTLYFFPYTWLANNIPVLKMPIKSIQYSWRFNAIAGVLLVWMLCIVMKKDWIDRKKKQIFAGALLFVAFWQGISYMSDVLNEMGVYPVFQKGNLSTIDVSNAEYLPIGPEESFILTEYISQCVEQLTYGEEAINVSEWHRNKGDVVVTLANLSHETQQLEVPLLNYKGYHAITDAGDELLLSSGTSHRISVSVPAGYSGTIRVGFREPWYWRICELISLFTLLCLVLYPFIRRNIKKTQQNSV